MNRNLKRSVLILMRAAMLALSLIVPAATSALPALAHTPAPAEADLAEMALTPGDLEAAGLADWAISGGQMLTPGALAGTLDFERDLSAGTSAVVLEQAGFVEGYELRLQPANDRGEIPTAAARASIFRFADETGAATAYAFLGRPSGGPYTDAIASRAELGDEHAIIALQGTTADPFHGVELTFRTGALVAQIRLVDFTGEEPAVTDLEQLGDLSLQRIDRETDQQPGGVRGQTIALAEPGPVVEHEYYTVADGEARRLVGQSADDFAASANDFEEAGLVDEFEVRQRVDDALGQGPTWFIFATQRFQSDAQAATYLQEIPARNDGSDGFENFRVIEDAAPLGDASLAYTKTLTWGSATYIYLFEAIQTGDRLGWVESISVAEPSLATLGALAAAQADCLADGACPAPVALPKSFAARSAGSLSKSSGHGPLGRVTDAETETLAIPELGLELTYDPATWEVQENNWLHTDALVLLMEREAGSVVSIGLDGESATARACVGRITRTLADDEAFGAARPLGDAERNAAAYGIHLDESTETFIHVECRRLDNGAGFAVITQIGPLANYAARSADREALLAGLASAS